MSAAKLYAIWAAIGPLVGVVIGSWLTRRWQRRQWVLDNKKSEYREVLDLLSTYRFRLISYMATYTPPPGGAIAFDPKDRFTDRNRFDEIQVTLSNALADRLFIRKELAKRNVRDEFDEFVRRLDSDVSSGAMQNSPSPTDTVQTFIASISRATTALESLHRTIVEIADRDLGLK